MAVVLHYVREDQRAPNTGQRIRLSAQLESPPVVYDAFNLAHPQGLYARTYTRTGDIRFNRSDRAMPPFSRETVATNTGDCSEGRFAWDARGHVRLFYSRSFLPGVYYRQSYDYGGTWGGETQLRSTARHPDLVRDLDDGTLLFSYYLGGVLTGRLQTTGELIAGAEFSMLDDTATPIALADDSHRIAQDARGFYWLHCRILAAADTSLWYSSDRGQTWTPTDGGVAGISNGRRAGVIPFAGREGGLIAWATVGGNSLVFTRRYSGESAWSAPVTVTDQTAGTLATADAASSFCDSYEGSGRVWLSAIRGSNTFPSEYYSADRGATFTHYIP